MRISESGCTRPLRLEVIGVAFAAAVFAAGCEFAPVRRSASDAAQCMPTEHLEYARSLSAAEPLMRARLHQAALAEYREQPDTRRKVRLALAASFLEPLPDEMNQTRALFRELLQAEPPSHPGLVALLEMRLNDMAMRLAAQKQSAQQQAELDEARAKIQALTTLEKTLEPSTGGTRGR